MVMSIQFLLIPVQVLIHKHLEFEVFFPTKTLCVQTQVKNISKCHQTSPIGIIPLEIVENQFKNGRQLVEITFVKNDMKEHV